ncbi:hypothetical protein HN51_040925 [Arachis hypogaea]
MRECFSWKVVMVFTNEDEMENSAGSVLFGLGFTNANTRDRRSVTWGKRQGKAREKGAVVHGAREETRDGEEPIDGGGTGSARQGEERVAEGGDRRRGVPNAGKDKNGHR